MTLYSKNRPRAQAKKTAVVKLPLHKQHLLRNVGLGEDSYACLSRELFANSHTYPDITQSDLAIAWDHNRREPAPTGRDAEIGGLADWLRGEGYVRRPGNHPGEFVWTKA
jgi:hypothetical protein